MNKRRLYFLLYYLVSALVIAAIYGSYDWIAYYRLVKKGTVTTATVTATDCQKSRTISYRFSVNGQSYSGRGGDSYGNPSCATLKSGDPLKVSYLTDSPEVNLSGDPQARLANESIALFSAALIVPMVLLFFGYALSRRFAGKELKKN